MDRRPPRLPRALLEFLLPWSYRDEVIGDLQEGYRQRADARGRSAALWYWLQVGRSVPGALRLRYQTRHDYNPAQTMMDTVLRDVRYAFRSLRKAPGFAIVSTVTLALAIGVNSSIFSLVSAVVFADLPMGDTETVAIVRGVNAELDIRQGSVSAADYLDLVERSTSYESLSALTQRQWVVTGGDQPMRAQGLVVNPGLFATWRLPPILGREFAVGEDIDGGAQVAMLSHGFWTDRYSADPGVLGETILLDGREYTIVGVTDPRLEFASFRTAQVLTPLSIDRGTAARNARALFVVGRLLPDVSHERAEEETRAIGAQLEEEYAAENRGWALWSAPAMESLIDEDGNRILLLLQLAVGMVILIACANVANMLLARGSARAREMAVRAALGARRPRLIRQLLTESVIISVASALLGLAVAWSLNEGLIALSAGQEVVFLMAELDGQVLGYTLAISLIAPLLFGLVPALRASGYSASGVLRESRGTDGGRAGRRLRGGLVTAQISLALTLMICATLVTRTVYNISMRPLGFDPDQMATATVALPDADYADAGSIVQFFQEASDELRSVPGITGVAMTNTLPGTAFGALRSAEVEGSESVEGRGAHQIFVHTITPGYFDVLGLDVLSGRDVRTDDTAETDRVAVLSRQVAELMWPGEDPIGRRYRIAGGEDWVQVVGVAENVRSLSETEEHARNVYVPHAQDPRRSMTWVMRTSAAEDEWPAPVRAAIWSVDDGLPIDGMRSMDRALYLANGSNYALTALFAVFAVFAMLMSAVGIYGVMAYTVAQRRNEIGVRLALGAEGWRVWRMVVRQGGALLAGGLIVGLLTSFLFSRLMGSLVYGISATDPATFIGVPLLLGFVAIMANLVPAVRASRLDPAKTLRAD
ncbi:MAG: ADOP family duplicated permease [Gemmatimonadota bacterium]